jgi:hypothetical protein
MVAHSLSLRASMEPCSPRQQTENLSRTVCIRTESSATAAKFGIEKQISQYFLKIQTNKTSASVFN